MGLGLLMKPRQRRNTVEKMMNTKSLQLARFSPISKQRQIYNTFFSVSVSLFILTKRKTTSDQEFMYTMWNELMCANKKNEYEKKQVLVVFLTSFLCTAVRYSVLDGFFRSPDLLSALGCYFSAWIGWQFAMPDICAFAAKVRRKKCGIVSLFIQCWHDSRFFFSSSSSCSLQFICTKFE